MRLRPRLTERAKWEPIIMKERGESDQKIADHIGASKSTVQNILNRYKETDSVAERYLSGRPKISTQREHRNLIRITEKITENHHTS